MFNAIRSLLARRPDRRRRRHAYLGGDLPGRGTPTLDHLERRLLLDGSGGGGGAPVPIPQPTSPVQAP